MAVDRRSIGRLFAARWLAWQGGTSADDWGRKIRLHPDGTLWVLGATKGKIPGHPSKGSRDITLWHLGTDGNELAGHLQLGTAAEDFGYNMDLDTAGNIWIVGNFGTSGVQVAQVDKTGKLGVHKVWQTAASYSAAATEIRVASDGALLIGGYSNGAFAGGKNPPKAATFHLFLLRLKPDGNPYL